MLVRLQIVFPRLRNIALQESFPIPAEDRGIPDGFIHVQPDKPAVQQVLLQLFDQQSLTADREKHLQQQSPQQFLRGDRAPPQV